MLRTTPPDPAHLYVPDGLRDLQQLHRGQQVRPLRHLLHHGRESGVDPSLGGATVTGDLTVVATDAPIDASGGIGASGGMDKIVVLASWYSAPASSCSTNGGNPGDYAIGIKNNFDMSTSTLSGDDNTAVLLYAPNGPVAFKNNADSMARCTRTTSRSRTT